MNRIILIGNGFDLAHGLPTRYSDFIEWYWIQWGYRLIHGSHNVESDRLCSFKLSEEWKNYSWFNALGLLRRDNRSYHWDEKFTVEVAKDNEELCNFTYLSPFFKEICNSIETRRWVDIENIFYDYLSQKSKFAVDAKTINDDLDFLRENLVKYLTILEQSIIPEILKNSIKKLFIKPFDREDFAINAKTKWQDVFDQRFEYDDLMWEGLISSYFNKSDTIHYNLHRVSDFVSKYRSNGVNTAVNIPDTFLLPDRTMLLKPYIQTHQVSLV